MKVVNSLGEEEVAPKPLLSVVTGGKSPPGSNWLSGLKKGSVFLCRPLAHKDKPFLEEYHIVYQGEKSCKLYTNLNQEGWFWVDPISFCGLMEKVEVLMEGTDE